MNTIGFQFEDVPLVLADYSSATPLAIALISGEADVSYSRVHGVDGAGFEFDITSVTLSAPIKGWPDVPIVPGCELWDWVTRSIVRSCTDEIYEAIDEACEPTREVA